MNTINNTLFIGKEILHFSELVSTNEYALNLISNNKPSEGTVISTHFQLAGRGQIGSKWESEREKNLTVSFILYPIFIFARQQFLLNQALCLSVFDFVAKHIDGNVKVKWPNDIYVNDKKIAGILIQNSIFKNHLQSSVFGLGININQTHFLSDAPNPTSFFIENKKQYNLESMFADLCQSVEHRYLQIRSGAIQKIQKDYLHHLYRFMEEGLYQRMNGSIFSGKITGIDDLGKLKIDHKEGEELFDFKEIKYL